MVYGASQKRAGTRDAKTLILSRAGAGNIERANQIRAYRESRVAARLRYSAKANFKTFLVENKKSADKRSNVKQAFKRETGDLAHGKDNAQPDSRFGSWPSVDI